MTYRALVVFIMNLLWMHACQIAMNVLLIKWLGARRGHVISIWPNNTSKVVYFIGLFQIRLCRFNVENFLLYSFCSQLSRLMLSNLQDIDKEISELKMSVNTRGRLVAAEFLKQFLWSFRNMIFMSCRCSPIFLLKCSPPKNCGLCWRLLYLLASVRHYICKVQLEYM